MKQWINSDLEYRILGCVLNHGDKAWPKLCAAVDVQAWGTSAGRCVFACLLSLDAQGRLHGRDYATLVRTESMRHPAKEFDRTLIQSDAWDGVLDSGGEVLEMVGKGVGPSMLDKDIADLLSLQGSREAQEAILRAYHSLEYPDAAPEELCSQIADMANLSRGEAWVSLADIPDPGSDTKIATWGVSEYGCDRSMDDVMPLCAGRYYVLSGKPGAGKSSLAIQVMAENAKQGIKSAFISMEMSLHDCYGFFRSHGLTAQDMRNINILDCGHLTPDQLSGSLKSALRSGASLVVIDHLAHIKPAGKLNKWESICEASNRIVEEIKRSSDAAVICVAQMTKSGRAEDKRGQETVERCPTMDDIAGGADVGNGAAWIGILWRPADVNKEALAGEQNVRLRVAKSRFTQSLSIDLRFHGKSHTFTRDRVDIPTATNVEHRKSQPISDAEDLWNATSS